MIRSQSHLHCSNAVITAIVVRPHRTIIYVRIDVVYCYRPSSSSSSRDEYYLGGTIALLLQDHRTTYNVNNRQFVTASTW